MTTKYPEAQKIYLEQNAKGEQMVHIGKDNGVVEVKSVVTRSNDRQFSDIVLLAIRAVIYGEQHNITKDEVCQSHFHAILHTQVIDYVIDL